MERLDYATSFLLFHGLSGHFTTISLMMFSMRMYAPPSSHIYHLTKRSYAAWIRYLLTLLMLSLSGASLRAFGNLTYSTEWLFHAGLTTIVPLIVEFLVCLSLVFFIIHTIHSLLILDRSSMVLSSVYSALFSSSLCTTFSRSF